MQQLLSTGEEAYKTVRERPRLTSSVIMPAPTDFSSASFWQSRFAHEEHFEWLDDGTTTLLPPLLDHLEHLESKRAGPELDPWGPGAARVLHIGSGSSDLALRVRTAFERYGMPPDGIMVSFLFACAPALAHSAWLLSRWKEASPVERGTVALT